MSRQPAQVWIFLAGCLLATGMGCGAKPDSEYSASSDSESLTASAPAEAEFSTAGDAAPEFPGGDEPQTVDPAPTAPAPDFAPEAAPELTTVSPEPPIGREIAPRTRIQAQGADSTAARPRYIETEDGRHLVDVFYATDRAPLFQIGPTPHAPAAMFAAGMAALFFTCLCVIAVRHRYYKSALVVTLAGIAVTGLWLRTDRIPVLEPVEALLKYGDWYGADRHERQGLSITEVGLCQVSLPSDHRVGHLESPSIFRLEFSEDRDKHVVIERVERLETEAFYASLSEHLSSSPREEALLFIHGYNVGFSEAVQRTAQIAYDLRFPGAAVCYTWPSQGGMASYKVDEANVGWTVLHLEEFVETLCRRSGVKRLHLIAHSMGNRALTQSLERLALRNAPIQGQIGQVILAAPDVDSSEFRQRYAPAIVQLAEHATLYASSHDRALLLSASIHGYQRAGLSGSNLTTFPGIETVDASPIDTSVIGHSYYGDNPVMIRDLRSLIGEGLPAENRSWLRKISQDPELQFWTFRPVTDPLAGLDDDESPRY